MTEKPSSALLHQLKAVTVEKLLATESMPIASCVNLCHRAADMLERLAQRLELSPNHSVDGIEARDATIKGLEQRIAELEAGE